MTAMAVSGGHAYIINHSQLGVALIRCSIAAEGTLSGCADTGVTGLVDNYGMTAHGSNLYIASYRAPHVRKCEIGDDGSVAACGDAGFPQAMAVMVEDIRLVDSTAYILDYDLQQVSTCAVLPNGSLSACKDAGATGLVEPSGFAISGNHMYLTNGADDVVRCIIDGDGSLTDCRGAGTDGFAYATQVAVRGSTVYITDGDEADVTICPAGSDGLLTGCSVIQGGTDAALNSIVLR
ncbi:hypothetical protein EZ313_00630 [Ramlibacter henchirensis]|uniref:Uncharacterized protein n=1 Tax=Ramlibacter henchirensis TaxID=204072 RepID=A0A4Z0C443_9BURK|nr:hypothetical protein [Ramlibacter henchirensis]TFZ05218.1 hypothetical protein EZ313_00630 [Ramlibacter henchirensis]